MSDKTCSTCHWFYGLDCRDTEGFPHEREDWDDVCPGWKARGNPCPTCTIYLYGEPHEVTPEAYARFTEQAPDVAAGELTEDMAAAYVLYEEGLISLEYLNAVQFGMTLGEYRREKEER